MSSVAAPMDREDDTHTPTLIESLYLTLDVHPFKGGIFCILKETQRFPGEKSHSIVPFFEESLTIVITHESGTLVIRLEAKFLGEKTQFHIGLITVQSGQ